MKKLFLIAIGGIIIGVGGLFWYDYSSQEKNTELCLRITEIDFKEAWNEECARLELDWDCNLPTADPNRKILEEELDRRIGVCYDRHTKFKIFTFLN